MDDDDDGFVCVSCAVDAGGTPLPRGCLPLLSCFCVVCWGGEVPFCGVFCCVCSTVVGDRGSTSEKTSSGETMVISASVGS